MTTATLETRQIDEVASKENPKRGSVPATLNPLPRSVHRSDRYSLLDGRWRFGLDPEDEGLVQAWYLGHDYSLDINLPSDIESYLGGLDTDKLDPLVAWYERDFTLPEEWDESFAADRGNLLQLVFGACGYETRFWVNGHPLRTTEGRDVHHGEYTLFSCEIPLDLLSPRGKPNRVTIRTADSLDPNLPRGKQQSTVYKRGGIWYQTISGPVRSIWIEPVPANRLRCKLEVHPGEEDLVEFTLTTRVRDAGRYGLSLHIYDRSSAGDNQGSPVASTQVVTRLEPGEARHRIALHVPGARRWSPEEPNLYRLEASLAGRGGATSSIMADFGIRSVEARGRWVRLNGEKTYLHGILYQPNVATFDRIAAHMRAIKKLGCNLARIHIAGVDPRIYDLADQMGLMLWVEVPSPHSSNEQSRAHHWAELMRLLPLITAHPSVCILSLYNEDWGIEDVATNEETRRYIAATYAFLRARYPQLLVVDNDGWKHVSVDGKLQSDLLTAHIYTMNMERWQMKLDKLAGGDMTCLYSGDWRQDMVVGDSFFYREQTPILVSEWGGFGWSGYGGPGESAEKAEMIRTYKRELRSRPIAGDVYTQATSIEEEVNGIIDPETGELLVPEGVLGEPPATD